MNFPTYEAFRANVQWLIEGDELENTFSPDVLDLVIGLGEQRVYSDLRASTMIAPCTLAVTVNVAPLPADLLELHRLYDDPNLPVEIIPYDRMALIGPITSGNTLYAAQDGDTVVFWPAAPATMHGTYYQRPPDIKVALNSTFQRYPDVFMYAALVEAASVTGEVSRIAEWHGKYASAVQDATRLEAARVYGGSRLRMRAL